MRISDWISDVCSSDLTIARGHQEAMRADGPEMTFGRRLHRHQPAQTSQSRFDHGRRERCGARDEQRSRQPGVVIAEAIFEPCPFGTFLFAPQPFAASGEFGTLARGGSPEKSRGG